PVVWVSLAARARQVTERARANGACPRACVCPELSARSPRWPDDPATRRKHVAAEPSARGASGPPGSIRRSMVLRPRVIVPLLVVLVLAVLFAVLTPVYTDLLFYRSVNFSRVFTTVLWTRVVLFVLFGTVMAVAIGTNLVLAYRLRPPLRPLSVEQQNLERYRTAIEPYLLAVLLGVAALFGLAAGLSASARWKTWLQWVNGQPFGVQDPQFHRDVSYYTFTYPFHRFLLGFLL